MNKLQSALAEGELHNTLAEVKALRQELAQLTENLQITIENHAIQVLRDYHLLDENYAPAHWKARAMVLEILAEHGITPK